MREKGFRNDIEMRVSGRNEEKLKG